MLSRDDGGKKRRGGDAVTKHIGRPFGSDNGAVVALGGIHMDMVFIHQKCLWDDGKPFVDFTGKFFVAAGEKLCKLCIVKLVLKDAGGKPFKIVFPFRLGLTGVAGYGDLGDLRFSGIITEEFRFVKDFIKCYLVHAVKGFRLAPEGTLVHQRDLLREEVQLAAYGIKPRLEGADDGDEDLLVHRIQFIRRKLGKVH